MSRADYLAWLEATEPARKLQHRQAAQARRWQQWYALHPPTPPMTAEEKHARRVAGGRKAQQTIRQRFSAAERHAWALKAGQAAAEQRRQKREERGNERENHLDR